MKCDCVEKLKNKMVHDGLNNVVCMNDFGHGLFIRFKYTPHKKDGTLAKFRKDEFVKANFCPFCGNIVTTPKGENK